MEDELNTKKDLEPLPANNHPFWKGAEKNEFKIGEKLNCDIKKHFFIQDGAQNATCQNCNVGYNLPVGSDVRNGHIYINGQLVI